MMTPRRDLLDESRTPHSTTGKVGAQGDRAEDRQYRATYAAHEVVNQVVGGADLAGIGLEVGVLEFPR